MIEKTYEIVCPHCQKKNKVFVLLNEDFNDPEEFYCDFCGLKMGEMPAAEPPETECLEKE